MATRTPQPATPSAARIDGLISQLTLEEKAALTVGRDLWTTAPIDRLDVPSIWMADGPTGVRKAQSPTDIGIGSSLPATCFPTESALAATWDVGLIEEIGRALGAEAQAQGVQVLLGPGVNLKRSPLSGRNFEYFSEDPVLSGNLAAAMIRGVQSQGVGTSLKHFVANENETGRMYADSILDERTLREIYLRPFEIAVAESAPWTIMEAYNRLNGVSCAEHRWLLHDLLVEEWGYDGIVVSDWMAVNDRVAGIEAGLHLQMPHAPTAERVVAAVKDGTLSQARLDEIVHRLLAFILKADAARRPEATFDPDEHHGLARRAAAAAVVLLKNDDRLLPLDFDGLDELAVIGGFATTPRFQGAGSSEVVPIRLDTAHEALLAAAGQSRVSYAPGYDERHELDQASIDQAVETAKRASAAVVFVGLPPAYETEGVDRTHIDLPEAHNALVEAVLAVQPRTVVVLSNGSAVDIPWVERAPAIVEAWLGGQAGGSAIVDVLVGKVNPSGKLAETFPVRLADTPSHLSFPDDGQGRTPFTEGIFAGYRWYDAREIAPRFPFGHGLSYTTFEYADLTLDREAIRDTDPLTATVTIRNSGDRAGAEVVQLYIGERAPRLPRPVKELKAFAKVDLQPGEERRVSFALSQRDFAFYDSRAAIWATTSGEFEIMVGASSRDIRLIATVSLTSTTELPTRFDRMTPIADWLAHPVGRDLIEAPLAIFGQRFNPGSGEPSPMFEAITRELPVGKLVVTGALTETDLARMLDAVNTPAGD